MADDVRVFTVPLDPRTGLFDDRAVRAWLSARELVRVESHFCSWRERPAFGLAVVTKNLGVCAGRGRLEVPWPRGAPVPAARDDRAESGPDASQVERMAELGRLFGEWMRALAGRTAAP